MRLSDKAIEEFREIYKKQFKEELSVEEANEKGLELLKFMKAIYKPIPRKMK